MTPIFHLSIPVKSLAATRAFYETVLGAKTGRVTERWLDLWCFGGQITIQEMQPGEDVPAPHAKMHFGGAVSWSEWEALKSSLEHAGMEVNFDAAVDEAKGQAKIYLTDPNGYVLEIKAYRSLEESLQPPASSVRSGAEG